jgi:hypothetical protein
MAAIAGSVSEDGSVFTSEDGNAVNLYSTPMQAGMEPRPVDLRRYAGREIAAVYQQSSGSGDDLYGVRQIGILEYVEINA